MFDKCVTDEFDPFKGKDGKQGLALYIPIQMGTDTIFLGRCIPRQVVEIKWTTGS